MSDQGPWVLRRLLRVELRRARNGKGMTQKAVADSLGWHPSKVLRIENGAVGITIPDLKALLDEYEVADSDHRAELIAMARRARSDQQSWWSAYDDVLSEAFLTYLGYESSAATIYQFEPALVPGLLQTEEYARALLRYVNGTPNERINRLWAVREQRQYLHERDHPPQMVFVLDEAVIRRWMGGAAVMREQLARLKSTATESPHISLQVIPFRAGGHTGLRGPEVILQFADPDLDDIGLLEDAKGRSVFVDAPGDTAAYLEGFWRRQDLALDKERSLDLIDEVVGELSKASDNRQARSPDD